MAMASPAAVWQSMTKSAPQSYATCLSAWQRKSAHGSNEAFQKPCRVMGAFESASGSLLRGSYSCCHHLPRQEKICRNPLHRYRHSQVQHHQQQQRLLHCRHGPIRCSSADRSTPVVRRTSSMWAKGVGTPRTCSQSHRHSHLIATGGDILQRRTFPSENPHDANAPEADTAVCIHTNSRSASGSTTTSSRSQTAKERAQGADDSAQESAQITTPREYDSDLVVVLDLDECLVHTQFDQLADDGVAWQTRQDRQQQQQLESARINSFPIHISGHGSAIVQERPFVRDFLQAVSRRYETHIFTAGIGVYAKQVLNNLDPGGDMITKAWYRESCDYWRREGVYVKNLNHLQFSQGKHNPRRTVLVDNNPLSFLANPQNGILVSDFYDDPDDAVLHKVLDLIHELDQDHADVRPFLEERFDLKTLIGKLLPHVAQKIG